MAFGIYIHATDSLALKFACKVVGNLNPTIFIYYIQPGIGSYVIAVIPKDNCVDNLAIHADSTIDIFKRRLCKAKKPKS